MFLKKSVMALASLAMVLSLFACSSDDDKDNSVAPEDDPSLSSDDSADDEDGVDEENDEDDKKKSSSSKADAPLSSMQYADDVTYVSVTEIMYNAPDGSDLEWIELAITSGSKISSMKLSGLRLDGAVSYTFPAEPLDVGQYIVVTNNLEKFKEAYPKFSGKVYGPWDKDPKTNQIAKLANEGDVIDVKISGNGDMSCAYGSEPPWPSKADGKGSSLVYIGGNPAQPAAWAASAKTGGNPGSGSDKYIEPTTVRLNEIQPFVLSAGEDGWIELYNSGKNEVDVSGWIFRSKYLDKEWTISSGKVPAGGYLVLDPMDEKTFGEEIYLNPKGGEYYLYEAVDGKKTGVESSLMLAASENSSGIVEVSDGSTSQGALESATRGKANSALKSGPIYVNEIYYHPPKEKAAIPFEFLELINKSDEDVNMYVSKNNKSKGWKIEGVRMEFSVGDVIPAGGIMLVVSDSLKGKIESVREEYGLKDVKIAFYEGKLSNRGEMIAVKKPFDYDPIEGSTTLVQWYYDWSDAVLYSDMWSGLSQADGMGKSLKRKSFKTMGYEASAWELSDPTPGK